MAEKEKPFDIQDYIRIALRRKWYIIIPLVVSVLASVAVYKQLPKIYRASTLVLVQSQRIPESYVRATVTDSIAERLNTITQEILSRTRLEKVIQDLNLYADLRGKATMEGLVEAMRRAIDIKVHSSTQYEQMQNSFTISFEGTDPRTVMVVTNTLAGLFIEENLRFRESQAEGTSEFLSKELQTIDSQLKKKEQDVRDFKERHMGRLPQQLEANLRILERLQQQYQTTSENIRAVEDKAVMVRGLIEQIRDRERSRLDRDSRRTSTLDGDERVGERGAEDPLITQYNILKRDLASAQTRYTESHPDVTDLKRKIAMLEPRARELQAKQKALEEAREKELNAPEERAPGKDAFMVVSDPTLNRLLTQYQDQYNEAMLYAKRLREEEKNIKDQIAVYQRRIEETPMREQELTLLTRDYELLKNNYQSLLDKKIQAQMAQNLEKKQQGGQFKVLDPARIPGKPVRPSRDRILLMGAIIGLAIGFGLTWFRETLDQSFHSVSDVEGYLNLPVLATIPNLREEKKYA